MADGLRFQFLEQLDLTRLHVKNFVQLAEPKVGGASIISLSVILRNF